MKNAALSIKVQDWGFNPDGSASVILRLSGTIRDDEGNSVQVKNVTKEVTIKDDESTQIQRGVPRGVDPRMSGRL